MVLTLIVRSRNPFWVVVDVRHADDPRDSVGHLEFARPDFDQAFGEVAVDAELVVEVQELIARAQ